MTSFHSLNPTQLLITTLISNFFFNLIKFFSHILVSLVFFSLVSLIFFSLVSLIFFFYFNLFFSHFSPILISFFSSSAAHFSGAISYLDSLQSSTSQSLKSSGTDLKQLKETLAGNLNQVTKTLQEFEKRIAALQ